jgi:hypothetical protein
MYDMLCSISSTVHDAAFESDWFVSCFRRGKARLPPPARGRQQSRRQLLLALQIAWFVCRGQASNELILSHQFENRMSIDMATRAGEYLSACAKQTSLFQR